MTPSNMQWIRVFACCLTAVNFSVGAVALIAFLNRTDIGHRTLIRLIIIFNTLVAGDACLGAWNQFHKYTNTFTMTSFGTAVFGTISVVYFLVTNRDVIRTLRVSEFADRLRKDKISDKDQARINMSYISEQTLKKSQELVMTSYIPPGGKDGRFDRVNTPRGVSTHSGSISYSPSNTRT